MTKPRKPKSPYAKYGKTPFRYSDHYQNWRHADSDADRDRQDRKFRRAWGLPMPGANGPSHGEDQ